MKKNIRIGELLVESGIINEEQLQMALSVQKTSGGKKLGDILIDLGVVTASEVLSALEKRLDVPIVNLSSINIPYDVLNQVPESFAKANMIIPVKLQGNTLTVATNDPLDYNVLNELSVISSRNIDTILALKSDIQFALERYYSEHIYSAAKDLTFEKQSTSDQLLLDMEDRTESVPLVKFVNTMIEQAYFKRASDIHIEPDAEFVRIRLRIDSELVDLTYLDVAVLPSLSTRIKIMSNMDIAEKRIPLDGRFSTKVGDVDLSVRVSSMPTIYGEKIVMRLFSGSKSNVLKVEQLGMNKQNMDIFYKLIKRPNGIILTTGPTGSGKTTTLYSILSEIALPTVNCASIEDPVEQQIAGVNQTQINVKAGLTFSSGLRSLLRQDPDIIMIGEIRDMETADIALKAAITGHLLISSMHTNDASSAFMRLVDMGCEPYIVATSVIGVIAQRLVKLICPDCRAEYVPSDHEKSFLLSQGLKEVPTLYYGKGCEHCNFTGHFGRTAVHEIVQADNKIRSMILENKASNYIQEYLRAKGQKFMIDNLLDLLCAGKVSMQELNKVNYEE